MADAINKTDVMRREIRGVANEAARRITRLGWVPDFNRTLGACSNHPTPDIFFPVPGDHTSIQAAKAVCRRCPFKVECAGLAFTEGHHFGVWGGTTTKLRTEIMKAWGMIPDDKKEATNG